MSPKFHVIRYIFFPLGNKIYFHTFIVWPPWKPSIQSVLAKGCSRRVRFSFFVRQPLPFFVCPRRGNLCKSIETMSEAVKLPFSTTSSSLDDLVDAFNFISQQEVLIKCARFVFKLMVSASNLKVLNFRHFFEVSSAFV